MSNRGSFVTEYFYCPKCRDAMAKLLCSQNGDIRGTLLADNTIIAGFTKASVAEFVYDIPWRESPPCHPVRIALLSEDLPEDRIFCFRVLENGEIEESE